MKCKTFKIRLQADARNHDEAELNKFLESIAVRQSFASIVGDEYWSVLVFYEDAFSGTQSPAQDNFTVQTPAAPAVRQSAAKSVETEKPAPEPIILTPEQENKFNLLKQWRNERANQDGVPP
ncbi:MAG TPA: hypothetical protein VGB68_02660, partial [Pyrinomonadaceae bacterium]